MKNILYLLSFLFVFSLNAQKNKNGNLYDSHPGIDLVASFHKAYATGDLEKASKILHEDVKWYDGNTNNSQGGNKQRVLNNINWFKNYFDYVTFNDSPGAYPDALEYKKDGNWIQSWFNVYGIHKETGVELDHPVLRLYSLNDDSTKIIGIIEYSNKRNFDQIANARTDMKNGTIYMSHEHINTVRKVQFSYQNGDVEKAISFFHENATINDINESKIMNMDETLERDGKMFANWTVTDLIEVGYPDYLEYDWKDSKVVLSWWTFKMKRKSDGKEVDLPVHFSDRFDNEGKIIRRTSYWNKSLLN